MLISQNFFLGGFYIYTQHLEEWTWKTCVHLSECWFYPTYFNPTGVQKDKNVLPWNFVLWTQGEEKKIIKPKLILRQWYKAGTYWIRPVLHLAQYSVYNSSGGKGTLAKSMSHASSLHRQNCIIRYDKQYFPGWFIYHSVMDLFSVTSLIFLNLIRDDLTPQPFGAASSRGSLLPLKGSSLFSSKYFSVYFYHVPPSICSSLQNLG